MVARHCELPRPRRQQPSDEPANVLKRARCIGTLAFLFGVAALSPPIAFAQHSRAAYDMTKEVLLEGTVAQVVAFAPNHIGGWFIPSGPSTHLVERLTLTATCPNAGDVLSTSF